MGHWCAVHRWLEMSICLFIVLFYFIPPTSSHSAGQKKNRTLVSTGCTHFVLWFTLRVGPYLWWIRGIRKYHHDVHITEHCHHGKLSAYSIIKCIGLLKTFTLPCLLFEFSFFLLLVFVYLFFVPYITVAPSIFFFLHSFHMLLSLSVSQTLIKNRI